MKLPFFRLSPKSSLHTRAYIKKGSVPVIRKKMKKVFSLKRKFGKFNYLAVGRVEVRSY